MLRLKTALVLAIRYLFLTRYSWLLAIVLVAIVPVSQILLPRLLANLFVVDRPEQLFQYLLDFDVVCGDRNGNLAGHDDERAPSF